KKIPLEQSIRDWQYVDRLAGIYGEAGAVINREPFGPLSGTLVPPFISHSVAIIEGLLALEQGVKSLTLGYGQAGNLIQDLAALISLRELADEYFKTCGYDDYELSTVFHQWMGGFPEDESKAFAVISWGSMAAALGKATKVIVKTPHEAMGIPTKEANLQGLKNTRQIISMLADQYLPGSAELKQEVEIIKRETKCIMNKVFELGAGNLADGAVRAFAAGVIDVPFAPSAYNPGRMFPIRDNNGAVRLLEKGGVPLEKDILDFHRSKIEERAAFEKRKPCFQMVVDDIYAISKGKLVGRPR
ncbi:MAG: methylaspartate mutase subunit E, partial [Lentisphaerae bacterium GWF2_44_16]